MLYSRRLRLTLAVLVIVVGTAASAQAQQTIVFFRHGEKPAGGLGQLTCQGLNRALALPSVLIGRYGQPDYLYAPDPAVKMAEGSDTYYYVRPLATLEPTAIRAGKSVNTHYGYNEINRLESLLIRRSKATTTIFVSWEHAYLVKVVQNIMNHYGGGVAVPAWTFGDYDSLYVVHVNYTASGISAAFERDSENLNGLPTTCPGR